MNNEKMEKDNVVWIKEDVYESSMLIAYHPMFYPYNAWFPFNEIKLIY